MIDALVIYFAVGKLSIYLIQKFPLTQRLSEKSELLEKLFNCSLCTGVYSFAVLAWLLDVRLMSMLEFPCNVFVDYFLTGAISSFVVYVFSAGWNDLFGTIVVS